MAGVVGDTEGVGLAPNGHGFAGQLPAAFRQVEVEGALHLVDVGLHLGLEFFLGFLDLLFPGGDGVIPGAGRGFLEFAAGAFGAGGAVLFRRVAGAVAIAARAAAVTVAATIAPAVAVPSPAAVAAIAGATVIAAAVVVSTAIAIAATVAIPPPAWSGRLDPWDRSGS